ncbi:MAG TPA: hypothetical protein VHV26_09815 [Rhizomicrobium sp.]|jgi:hypothetical protein|nr:hypothetical protein [Rhizomicrobium sp.]
MRRHSSGYDVLFFLAIFATLLSLAPGLAHLFELPRKIELSQRAYFTVQQIYRGWDLFGIAILVQLGALILLSVRSWRDHYLFRPVLAALIFLLAAQILFWLFTFPVNVATENWTRVPPDWQELRLAWEYSHACGALCQLLGLCCLIGALFARARTAGR